MDDEKTQPMWINLLPTICFLLLVSSAGGVLCPNGCKCENEVLRANCSGAGIQVVPIQLNPELHVMDLSHNKITQLYYTFTFYEKLHILDLSKNKVKTIGQGNFKTQRLLTFLNLSSNYIEVLEKDTFEGLSQLTQLDLNYNCLETIASNAFKDLHSLKILRMNSNKLDYFEKATFQSTPNLQELFIDDNYFTEIASNLADLAQLKMLSLARNLIEVIENDKVPNLPELETLVLVQNLIIDIQPRGFANFPKLDHLDISDNNLTVLPTTSLSKLSKLINLKLSGNSFNYLPPVAFRGLFHLKYLVLTRIESLEFIDARAFVDNINLEKISMDYNYKIKTLPTRLFYGNPKLRYVSIRYNSIKSLIAAHFPLDQLNHLRVGGNPLDCNCSIGWLWRIMQENNLKIRTNVSYNRETPNLPIKKDNELILDVNDIICETPEELHNKKLFSATQRQMDCSMSWLVVIIVFIAVILILGTVVGVFFVMTKRKSTKGDERDCKINKTSYSAPSSPPSSKSLTSFDVNHVERYIMPPPLVTNRSMPMGDSYSQHCNGNSNIYEQLNYYRHRPHIVYV